MQTHPTSANRATASLVRQHLRDTRASSLGDTERLANIHTAKERHDLWFAHQDKFGAPTQVLFDTVMADCHRRIAKAINDGVLSLWPRQGGAA